MTEFRLVENLQPNRVKGWVALVEDAESNTRYVLKGYSPGFSKEFGAEVQAYSLLPQGTSFLRCYGEGLHQFSDISPEDLHCLCLQYAEHRDLHSLFFRFTQPCRLPVVRALFWQLLRDLKALHESGLTHNHLSLTNLLLDDNFNLYIAGLGRASHHQKPAEFERSVQVDIFSCGVLLLRMLKYPSPFWKFDRFDPLFRLVLQDDFEALWKAYFRDKQPLAESERVFLTALFQAKRPKSLEELLQHDWFREPTATVLDLHTWVMEATTSNIDT